MNNELALNDFNAELLPERNTMWGVTIGSPFILASNSAETVQAVTLLSSAHSTAVQSIGVFYF